jgi:hypothetical protein
LLAIGAGVAALLLLAWGVVWLATSKNQRFATDRTAGEPDHRNPAAGMKWLALTEDERSRWKRMRNKVRQQFEAAVRRVDDTDILMADGVIVPGTEEEMRKQRQESERKIAELQRKRLEEARGRRFQYLVYSTKAKSWAAASITTTVTGAGLRERPAFGTDLPR